jgi:hypothetical protein
MSHKTVLDTWTGLVKALQQHVDAPDAADVANAAAVAVGVTSIGSSSAPPLPHAAWKTLVQDVQVCWHVLPVWLKQGSTLHVQDKSSTVQDTCRRGPARRRTPAQHALKKPQHAHQQYQS